MTSNTTIQPAVTSVIETVAMTGHLVGNASFGRAVVYAESVTASGFDGTYTCIGRYNDSDLPLYTILKYKLDVGKNNDVIIIISSSNSSNN